jgi:hypothetical protein
MKSVDRGRYRLAVGLLNAIIGLSTLALILWML